MVPILSDVQVNSLAIVIVAAITIIPTTLAAVFSFKSNKTSNKTAKEVLTNGGMDTNDPDGPNINDHIKHQTRLLEEIQTAQSEQSEYNEETRSMLKDHMTQSKLMDQALAEVYLEVMPQSKVKEAFEEQRKRKP